MAFSSIAGALPFTSDNRVKALANDRDEAQQRLSRSADGRRGGPAGLRGRLVARHLRAREPAAPVLARLNED